MSVSITQTPAVITFSDNPIYYVFKQSLTELGDIKYKMSFIVDVWIAGEGFIAKLEIYPEYYDGSFAYGKLDISNFLSVYLKELGIKPLFDDINNIIYDPGSSSAIYITVTEKYTLTEGGTPALDASVDSAITFVVKGSLSLREFNTFDLSAFSVGGAGKRFLTDKPYKSYYGGAIIIYEYDFKKEDSFSISYLDPTYDGITPVGEKKLYVTLTDSVGGTVFNYVVDYLPESQGSINKIYFNLEQQKRLGLITGTQYNNTQNILLTVLNLDLDSVIGSVLLKCVDPCFYPGKSVQWLNKYGGYDYYLFKHNERISASIRSLEYSEPIGGFDFNGNVNLSGYNSGRSVYMKETTEKMQLISDYLDEAEQNWIVQLYESPLVYLNEGENFENAIVTNTGYQKKQDEYDELFSEIVEIEFNNKKSVLL